jgi:hypothetical protein
MDSGDGQGCKNQIRSKRGRIEKGRRREGGRKEGREGGEKRSLLIKLKRRNGHRWESES